ncbi:MAG: TonB-dependent receptor [Alphaproteobacteria bacterium]|nr:TonB-dependent receptor [Alphaproteobacteria bacterium]
MLSLRRLQERQSICSLGGMFMTNLKRFGASSMTMAAVLGFGAIAVPAYAQNGASSDEDTIVVTATRREQSLQDTPVAVTAVGAETLEQQNVVSTQDLQRVAPTLVISSSNSETGGSTIRIRGVGTTGNNAGLEGAVGVFIDGVYRQRAGLALNNLFDLQRIEVLRGPQGTLFGKNTSAGALVVVPNLPRLGEFDGSVRVGLGNFENREFEGMLNIPLGDTLAARVAGTWQEREGFVDDVLSGRDSFNRDRQLVRGMLLWAPTDSISWRGTIDYSKKDEDCCQAVYNIVGLATVVQNSLVPGAVIPASPELYQSINTPSRPFIEQTEDIGYSSHLEIDLPGDITFKNIIAHREFESQNDVDADFGAADILYQRIANEQKLTSVEATLNGAWGAVDWLVGAYYAEETVDQTNQTPYGAQLGAYIAALGLPSLAPLYPVNGGAVAADFVQDGTSWSVFTHNQIDFTDRLGGVIGIRFNHEEKDGGMSRYVTNSPSCGGGPFDGQGAAAPAGLPATLRLLCPRPTYQSTIEEEETTGTVGLNYDLTDDILVYLSYSRGYKAGGINLDRDAPAALGINPATGLVVGTQAQVNDIATFDPEFSDSYELGVRSQWFDGTLTLNVTLFQTDYEDFQLNTFNGLGFTISNPGSVESEGFEIEGAWRAGEDLDVTFGIAQTVAKYGNDPDLRVDPADAAGLRPDLQDRPLAGRTLTNAPKWSVSAGLHYEHAVHSNVMGFFDISASYRSHYNTGSDLADAKTQDAFTLVNGRIGLFTDEENGWEFSVWGNNLFDQYSQTIAFDTVFQSGSLSEFPNPPRMYGVSFRKNF